MTLLDHLGHHGPDPWQEVPPPPAPDPERAEEPRPVDPRVSAIQRMGALTPELPGTPEEVAEAAMRRAEIAVVEHRATDEQRRHVAATAQVHTRADPRRMWMAFDDVGTVPPGGAR